MVNEQIQILQTAIKEHDDLINQLMAAINNHSEYINGILNYLKNKYPEDFKKPEKTEEKTEESHIILN